MPSFKSLSNLPFEMKSKPSNISSILQNPITKRSAAIQTHDLEAEKKADIHITQLLSRFATNLELKAQRYLLTDTTATSSLPEQAVTIRLIISNYNNAGREGRTSTCDALISGLPLDHILDVSQRAVQEASAGAAVGQPSMERISGETFIVNEHTNTSKRLSSTSSIAMSVIEQAAILEDRQHGSKVGKVLMVRKNGILLRGFLGKAKFHGMH